MTEAKDIELLYDLWEQNIETLRTLQRYSKEKLGIVPKLVAHLRLCAVGLVKQAGATQASKKGSVARSDDPVARRIIDKSTLAIGEPKRIRCREHLRYVASQPCVICGRSPSHAHHVRYAQRRGLGIKASDEFAVPLCRIHHRLVHRVGNEAAWWQDAGIDPIKAASKLWGETRAHEGRPPSHRPPPAASAENPTVASDRAAHETDGPSPG
jgi:hypothetical protein